MQVISLEVELNSKFITTPPPSFPFQEKAVGEGVIKNEKSYN